MAILTVYTKLLDKTLEGARIIDMGSTRTCQMFVVPRDKMEQVSSEKMLHQYCTYILLGKTKTGKPKAYIGQSNDFLHRIIDHKAKKDFWDTALVFVSKANEIYASEVLYLEYLGIKLAKEAETYSLDDNKQIPQKPSIAPDKENDMELFFEEICFLTKFFGCTLYEKQETGKVMGVYHDFHLKSGKDIDARMRYFPADNTFVILSGSRVRAWDKQSIPKSAAEARKKVFSDKELSRKDGDSMIILKDFTSDLTSPSGAGSFCTGTSLQGTTSWVDKDGKTFADIFPKTE